MECLLIADDLTGACDAAVHFAMRGLRPTVVRLPGHSDAGGARVLACSTESRDFSVPEIRAALRGVASEFADSSVARVFKKIDSTLRGNVGIEVVATRDAFGCEVAVVCPAFPAMGRVVECGVLRAPEFTPVDVAERLRTQSGEACIHVRPEGLAAEFAAGARLISVDARSDDDLDRIAAALACAGRRILWAGSAGLASALARCAAEEAMLPPRSTARGPVLFCIGSDHPVTLAQQAALLSERPCMLLRIPRGRMTADEVRTQIAGARLAALVLSGGDTASLVCQAIGACAIELLAEIVPGVPYGSLRGGAFDGIAVVTKSGGFGDRDTLVNVADFFHAPI